ncbi:hypothetical protein imdm_2265 [gamma proteobacterium IMCC2047]|nr:hypothetical protein imdm_2265 [gamma proteobacterium IMCC2047]
MGRIGATLFEPEDRPDLPLKPLIARWVQGDKKYVFKPSFNF